MDSVEKLILFMEEKNKEIERLNLNKIPEKCNIEVKDNRYFTEKDIESIKNWDFSIADSIWSTIKYNVNNCRVHGITSSTCPFCVKITLKYLLNGTFYDINDQELCEECEYALNRDGIRCANAYSIVDIIQANYYGQKLYNTIFTNEWYRKVIEDIESKEKIILYMEYINGLVFPYIQEDYYTPEDIQKVKEWENATEVWLQLIANIFNDSDKPEYTGIGFAVSPFCLYYNEEGNFNPSNCYDCDFSDACLDSESKSQRIINLKVYSSLTSKKVLRSTIKQIDPINVENLLKFNTFLNRR